ncbi:unnamed protein product [Owenia fusiformis]|uniref:Uncharacterized protein n=1 Tax=Owenia fusiformis TaxID=6347 RepID=A0A8J1XHT2_OWEFU|nr:unnamed protein product [Owenia fusiformis]
MTDHYASNVIVEQPHGRYDTLEYPEIGIITGKGKHEKVLPYNKDARYDGAPNCTGRNAQNIRNGGTRENKYVDTQDDAGYDTKDVNGSRSRLNILDDIQNINSAMDETHAYDSASSPCSMGIRGDGKIKTRQHACTDHEHVGGIPNTPDNIIVRTFEDTPKHKTDMQSLSPECVPDITVRTMEEHDAEFVGRMEVESFKSKYEWAVGKSRTEGVAMILEKNSRNNVDGYCRTFIAEYKNKPAGMIIIKLHGDEEIDVSLCDLYEKLGCYGTYGMLSMACLVSEAHTESQECYVECVCVHEAYRGKGIGTLLLERAEYEAKAKGCSKMSLHVAQRNRAASLYHRQGYHIAQNEDGFLCTWCAVGIRRWYKMTKMV